MAKVRQGSTWIDSEELAYNTYHGGHSRSSRKGLVRWEDGRLRAVTLGIPDTYFSIPAHGRLAGKYISGFVSMNDAGEFVFQTHSS